jgi:type I restriction enzyme, S subunit
MQLSDAFWFQEGPGVRNWQFALTGVKLLNVANITTAGEIDLSKTDRCLSEDEVRDKYTHFLVDAGDLVIASSGISFDKDGLLRTRGAFIEKKHLPLCMNTSTIRFKAKTGMSDLRYLKFWLDSYEFRRQITRLVTGSAQQNFGPSHLNAVHITLPQVEKQRRIATLLDKADRLRRTHRYVRQLSDTILSSVFLEMFGDPQRNPKGWNIQTIETLLSTSRAGTQTGPFGSSLKRHEYVKSGIPVWGINNVRPNEFVEQEPLFITPEKYNDLTTYSVESGDILVSRAGTVGRMCVARPLHQPSIIGTNLVRVSLNCSLIAPEYFVALFTYFPERVGRLRMSNDDNAYSFLNPSVLKTLEIPIPPLPVQERFVAAARQRKRIDVLEHEADRQTEHLFQTLLHNAFSDTCKTSAA